MFPSAISIYDTSVMRIAPISALAAALFLLSACAATRETMGRSWSWERVQFSPASARVLAFDTDVAVYATDRGFTYSTDFRKFQYPQADLPGDPEVVAVATAPGIRDIYAITDHGYLLRSNDRGRRFSMIGQFPNVRVGDMVLTRAGRLFVGTSSGVLVSTLDLAGIPARRARTYLMPFETLVLGLPIWRRVNLASDADLWKDWTVIVSGNVTRLVGDPHNPDHLVAEILGEGVKQTWDEGETWEAVRDGEGRSVRGPIAFGPDSRVLVGAWLSKDGGRTYARTALVPDREDLRQQRDSEFAARSVAVTSDALWALNYRAAAVYRSHDEGATWVRAGEPTDFLARPRETSPSLLAVDPFGRLWVATDGHGLFRYAPVAPVATAAGTRVEN